jgi:hypothetical protein
MYDSANINFSIFLPSLSNSLLCVTMHTPVHIPNPTPVSVIYTWSCTSQKGNLNQIHSQATESNLLNRSNQSPPSFQK